jgi:ABC-type Na+ efflux pump permease subunit
LEVNPFFWLASRDQRKPHYVLALLALAALAWLGLYWRFGSEMLDPVMFVFIAVLVHTILKFWVATESCRQIAEDRRTGALELLLSTPLSVADILHGQLLSLNRQFFMPVAAVLLVDIAIFTAHMRDVWVGGSNEGPLLFVCVVAVFIADLYTLAWLGMWLGLTLKTANRAASAGVVRVLVLPWIAYIALMTMLAFLRPDRSSVSDTSLIAAWLVVSMLNNLYFYTSARRNLLDQFRLVATQRFDPGKTGLAADTKTSQYSNTVLRST